MRLGNRYHCDLFGQTPGPLRGARHTFANLRQVRGDCLGKILHRSDSSTVKIGDRKLCFGLWKIEPTANRFKSRGHEFAITRVIDWTAIRCLRAENLLSWKESTAPEKQRSSKCWRARLLRAESRSPK